MIQPRLLIALTGLAVTMGACRIETVPAEEPKAAEPAPAPKPAAGPAPTAAPAPQGPYDPCGGKKCGERCAKCPPDTPSCIEDKLVKLCHPDGECKPATTVECPAASDGGAEDAGAKK